MKKYILLTLIVLLALPALLQASVKYLGEEDYKELKKEERLSYWNRLESELATLQQRKAKAIADSAEYAKRIEDLKAKKDTYTKEYNRIYQEIIASLNINKSDIASVMNKISYFNRTLANWEDLSDKELWNAKKTIRSLVTEYNDLKETNAAKAPDFRDHFSDLDNKIANLEANLQAAKPKYYEDDYTVAEGDNLAKIAGYSFIYDDVSKWPIIYRANRDIIKDPNMLTIDQVIKIPRGLPYTWKVYKGECLWKIASYPEVYGDAVKWPLIYRANKDQIKDPDLIYPNQVFEIPRD
jgi:nucleoid-associated protein YgaU